MPAPHTWKAPSHDPLCRQQHWEGGDCFDCRLIAKVRADERERNREADGVAAYLAVEKALIDLRASVEALTARGVVYPYDLDSLVPETLVYRTDVLALLDGGLSG